MRFLLQFYGRMSADNFDLFHHDRGAGLIVPVSGNCGDFIHSVHAADNMAKCSILAIQMRSILVHDEELAAGRVGVHSAGHADHAAGVLDGVVHAVLQELALDVPAGAAGALPDGSPP
mgnify:FL=1